MANGMGRTETILRNLVVCKAMTKRADPIVDVVMEHCQKNKISLTALNAFF